RSALPAMRLARHSTMNDRPEPFAPPIGRGVWAACGSVVGRPCASSAQPSGIGLPAFLAWFNLPIETMLVALSRTTGSPPGTAIAMGVVDTPDAREPW